MSAVLHIGAIVVYVIVSVLVGVEWLARQQKRTGDDTAYAVFVGAFWWISLPIVAVIRWYRYRAGRLARKADR